jgi:LysR family transcriptional regulator, nod-box dependent transcriptional activator
MRFKGLDLNLLLAFQVLMEERSVTRAARRLHVSQPAMSSALGRLRDYFRDPILVAHGKRLHPTAHAERLFGPVRQFLSGIDGLLTVSAAFDPATTQRTFRIVASDYITASLIGPLAARLAAQAPGVKLEFMLPSEEATLLVMEGKADLLITPKEFTRPDQPSELLCRERQVVVGWSENPLLRRRLTGAAFGEAGHVAVVVGSNRVLSFADRQIERLGRRRKVEITCGCFTMVPWLLQGTQRLALMHERLARQMVAAFPLTMTKIPFAFPVMQEMMQYHRARQEDPGVCWLRAQLKAEARRILHK